MQGQRDYFLNKSETFLLLSALTLAISAATVLVYTQIASAGLGQHFFYARLYFIVSLIMGSFAVAYASYRISRGRLRYSIIHGIVAGFAMFFVISFILMNVYGS
ncbi:hypothetical protein SOASR030_01150 [Leminorella grimontii]|uniref:Uncharacterized protein n=1 Tax=Leminorella grimontii TaxID=82981 RepID=A0AAV5MXL7_9GAMM|nr:hypothetical protein GLGR_1970 [Leminorella grimontii ATCC 33999 = DSM 5078]GKX54003.1 hypothetical protein SOASR030_01150 [Leminorella grimontii]GKX60244.1 hypothetical protein SOASR031_25590 [Leminorella grimontii]VFS60339.1 Uncharacterised protein [Leminorella grimontii]